MLRYNKICHAAFALLAAVVLAAGDGLAATKYWKGSTSAKASVAKNWADDAEGTAATAAPQTGDDIVIDANSANKAMTWDLKEMDADHVTAWSKGGATSASNCQMLCKTHNRAKGNR